MSNEKKYRINNEESHRSEPSQWQRLFGRNRADGDQLDDTLQNLSNISISEWANITEQQPIDDDIHQQWIDAESMIPEDNLTNREVADVISQMERILSDSPNSSAGQWHTYSTYDDIGVNLEDSIDLESSSYCKFFTTTSSSSSSKIVSSDSRLTSAARSHTFSCDGAYNSESVALAFRKKINERVLRGCFDSILHNAKKEKKRLRWIAKLVAKKRRGKVIGKSFLAWKHYIRVRKMKEAMLVCKVGRATSRMFRMAFAKWKKMAQKRIECEKQLYGRLRQRRLRRVFSFWLKFSHRAKCEFEVGYGISADLK